MQRNARKKMRGKDEEKNGDRMKRIKRKKKKEKRQKRSKSDRRIRKEGRNEIAD